MRSLFPPLVLAVLTGSLLEAQNLVYVPDGKSSVGVLNSIPLGGKGPNGAFQNMRTQILVPARFLPSAGSTITDLGFAAGGKGTYSYKTFKVVLSHLKGTKLQATFDANLADPVEVLNVNGFKYDFPKADAFHPLRLKGAFKHDGKRDLVVEILIQGAFFNGSSPGSRRSTSLETVFALSYDPTKPVKAGWGPYPQGAKLMLEMNGGKVIVFGSGCKGSDGKVPGIAWSRAPATGTSLNASLGSGKPSSAAMLLIGMSASKYGTLNLPLDLKGLGAPGCSLLTEILLMLPARTSKTGTANQLLPIPADANLRGKLLVGQWAVVDGKANLLGLCFSNGAKATIR